VLSALMFKYGHISHHNFRNSETACISRNYSNIGLRKNSALQPLAMKYFLLHFTRIKNILTALINTFAQETLCLLFFRMKEIFTGF